MNTTVFAIVCTFSLVFCSSNTSTRLGDIDIMAPNLFKILNTSAEVFTTLGNISLESFARKFFKIDDDSIFTALKGVSIVGSVASGTLEMPDESTRNLLKTVEDGLEQLAQKVYSQETLLFTSMDEIASSENPLKAIGGDINNITYINGVKKDLSEVEFMIQDVWFKARVLYPANTTTHSMMDFINNNSSENKANFLANSSNDTWDIYSIANGYDLLKTRIDSSRFDKRIFDELCGNITIYYFQAYVTDFFRIGVEQINRKYVEQQDFEYKSFMKQTRKQQYEVIQKASSYYYSNYFPGVIRQDIVRPAIDNIGGDNCIIALNIVNQLNSKYPWRRYAIIVSDGVRQKDQYAYFGFPRRMIVDDDYNGKTVLIFMSTKNPERNRQSYMVNDGRNQTISLIRSNFNNSENLNTALAFAKKGKNYYQMAVIQRAYNPCLPPLNANISDAFDLNLKYGPEISVAVVF